MSYETADILDRAADVIERDGWIQHKESSDQGVCLMGALRRGAAYAERELVPVNVLDPVRKAATSLQLPNFGQLGAHDLADWNDAPERTEQEVLDTLRLAARQERCAEDGVA